MGIQLTNHEVFRLVTFIVEDHGLGLAYDNFTEAFFILCEDVAGWDLYKPQQQDEMLNAAFTIYQSYKEENEDDS